MEYAMKDLGYPRTPTTAIYRIEMPDGSRWDVPVQVIADDRDAYYSDGVDGDGREDTVGGIRNGTLSLSAICDWASGNMNWSDVRDFAERAPEKAGFMDWEEGWCNGCKDIVGPV